MSWECNKFSWKICDTLNKNTDKCSGCGLMVKDEDKKIINRSAGKQWYCPKMLLEECGIENDRSDKQCSYCGSKKPKTKSKRNASI
ncbi:hypothetical protein F8M41_024609 [Gigaspora margarita]|uniref:RanBP2-type domain-containing protein n=1 Tax=Gigaspora margarita TaxID=4874 RepID=A0A8H3XJW9_GIGMA|nr:hypothetical protein F8M41_024609 [Gigaspora margarita]